MLRVNPLTSSDLVSYAAGLTDLKVTKVMAATLVGMAPLCYGQAFFAATLFDAIPWLITPLVVVCVGYVSMVLVAICRSSS